jgi:hypothetical protein
MFSFHDILVRDDIANKLKIFVDGNLQEKMIFS